MNDELKDIYIVIPSYKPDYKLIEVVKGVIDIGFENILIVDDGSGDIFLDIFNNVKEKYHVTLLKHEKNKGKGAALKTAFRYIHNLKNNYDIITIDADNQHMPKDIYNCAIAMKKYNCVILGSRNFDLDFVPKRSRIGNKLTSFVYKISTGILIKDTQTGLRAFPNNTIELLMNINGDRYEYEMTVLMMLAEKKIKMKEITIETVYDGNNEGSHFNPFTDSIKIYSVILKNSTIVKCICTSLLSFGINYFLAILLNNFVFTNEFVSKHSLLKILSNLLNTFPAWIVASFINFNLNKFWVFKSNANYIKSLIEYYGLAALMYFIKTIVFLDFFNKVLMIPFVIAMPMSETVMYIANYFIQKKFIFKKNIVKDD